jgi:6-phosphofructokinase 1
MPEIPYSYDRICAKIEEREERGRRFTIVVVAEGARPIGGEFVTSGESTKPGEARLGGVGAIVTAELERRTGKETRCCVLGHLQRGGRPTTFDRALCSIFGAEAIERVAAGDFGKMVAYLGSRVSAIPIRDAVDKLKVVRPDGSLVRTARALGICLGD